MFLLHHSTPIISFSFLFLLTTHSTCRMWSPACSFEFCLLLFIHHNNTSVYIVFRFGLWLESIIYYHYYYYPIIIILSLLLRIEVRFTTLRFTSINRFRENYCRVVYKPKLYCVEQTSINNNIISRLTLSTNNIISRLTPSHIISLHLLYVVSCLLVRVLFVTFYSS